MLVGVQAARLPFAGHLGNLPGEVTAVLRAEGCGADQVAEVSAIARLLAINVWFAGPNHHHAQAVGEVEVVNLVGKSVAVNVGGTSVTEKL